MGGMKNVHLVLFSLAGLFFSSCMTPGAQRLQTDPRFQQAAQQLVTGYLEGQKKGESGVVWGNGAAQFYNLSEYRIENYGWEWGSPAVFVRVKAGNKIGGNPIWENYSVQLSHDPELEAHGDPYMGLRISMVGPSIVKY